MRIKEWIFRVILPFVLVVAGVGLLGIKFLEYRRADSIETEHLKEVRQELILLDSRKRNLTQKIADLKRENNKVEPPAYLISPVFTSLDNLVLPDMSDVMKEYGWTGTMALSTKEFPGKSDKISKLKYEKMLEDGWESCLYWKAEQTLPVFLETMKRNLKKEKLEFPKTLIIGTDDYPQNYDEIALKYGIEVTALPEPKKESVHLQIEQSESGIRNIALCDWYDGAFDTYLSLVENEGGVFFALCELYYEEPKDNINDLDLFVNYLYTQVTRTGKGTVGPLSMDPTEEEQIQKESAEKAYSEQLEALILQLTNIDAKRKEILEEENTFPQDEEPAA